MNYLFVGYSEIASEIIKLIKSTSNKIFILTRKDIDNGDITSLKCDLSRQNDITSCLDKIPEIPDIIICTSGMLYDNKNQPEKKLESFNTDWFFKSLEVNTLPSLFVAQYYTKKMSNQSSINMFCFSARVGSIDDNKKGGWYSYRVSKSALNMIIKNISIEWNLRFPKSFIYGYHPGTVSTNSFSEYQKNTPKDTIQTPKQAAQKFLDFMKNAKPTQSGYIYDWENKIIRY